MDTLRDGPLKVAIFRNHGDNGDYYTLRPCRIYTDDKTGEVRESSSLSGSEPLRMSHLLTRSYERANELRAQAKAEERTERDDRPRTNTRTRRERTRERSR